MNWIEYQDEPTQGTERTPAFHPAWTIVSVLLLASTYPIAALGHAVAFWSAQVLFQCALGAAAMAAAGRVRRAVAFERIGWVKSRLSLRQQIIGAVVCLGAIACAGMFFENDNPILPSSPFGNGWGGYVVLFASLVLLPSVFEEMLFRGALQRLLTIRFGPPVAIFSASILFAVLHSYAGANAMYFSFVLGLCLATIRHQSGSVRQPMLIHALNNTAYLLIEMG